MSSVTSIPSAQGNQGNPDSSIEPKTIRIQIRDIVRPIGDDQRNAFFRVLDLSRNGWATCLCIAYASGVRPTIDGASTPKFRTRLLKRVDSLPAVPAAA